MIRATKEQIDEFEESMLWKDIVDELEYLKKLANAEFIDVGEPRIDSGEKRYMTTAETLIHLGDIKGRIKAVDHFLDILEVLKGTKEAELEEEKLNKKI